MRYREIGSKSEVFVLRTSSWSKDRRVRVGKIQRSIFRLGRAKERHF